MKEWKNKGFHVLFGLIPFILMFSLNNVFPSVATVQSFNANIYENPGYGKILFSLMPGMVVNIENKDGFYSKVSYKKFDGWVLSRDLQVYDNLFSNVKSKVLITKNIFQEKDRNFLIYYNKGKLIKYNLNDRLVENFQKIKDLDSIYSSPKNDIFLLEGVTTNGIEVHNFEVYNFSSGKSVYIGSLAGNLIKLESVHFSEDSENLCLILRIGGSYYTVLYKSDSGELQAFAKNSHWVNWSGNLLVMNNNDYFWYFNVESAITNMDVGYQPDRVIVKIKQDWRQSAEIESSIISNNLYILTKNGVLALDLNTKEMTVTPFRSLIFNNSRTINFYTHNESAVLKNLTGNNIYPEFSGREPKIEFVSFLGKGIIGRTKIDKIETLILYSGEGKELYRYKAVDDPDAESSGGIMVQLNNDKDMSIINVEDPEKGRFYLIRDKEQE